MPSHETDERYEHIKDHLKMCNTVNAYYPELYLQMVESDMRDQEFRAKIKKLYLQATQGR